MRINWKRYFILPDMNEVKVESHTGYPSKSTPPKMAYAPLKIHTHCGNAKHRRNTAKD